MLVSSLTSMVISLRLFGLEKSVYWRENASGMNGMLYMHLMEVLILNRNILFRGKEHSVLPIICANCRNILILLLPSQCPKSYFRDVFGYIIG